MRQLKFKMPTEEEIQLFLANKKTDKLDIIIAKLDLIVAKQEQVAITITSKIEQSNILLNSLIKLGIEIDNKMKGSH